MTAAGIFQYILNTYVPSLSIPSNTDLSSTAIACLMNLMLAEAQECVVLKACIDGVKDAAISKLAASCGDLYDKAYDSIHDSVICDYVGNEWISHFRSKNLYFYAVAQYRKSLDCCPQGKYGEEIVRLEQAKLYLSSALEMQKHLLPSLLSDIKTLDSLVAKNLSRAQKDNDLIYHSPLPNAASLPSVGRAEMVKCNTLPDLSSMSEVIGKPLFYELVPLAIQTFNSVFEEKKRRLVQSILAEYSGRELMVESFLSDNNIRGGIEAAEQPIGIPSAVLDKSRKVKENGGSENLSSSLKTLEVLRIECENCLNEIDRILDEEEKEDSSMRHQFSDRWQRAPSAEITVNLRKQAKNLRDAFQEASQSDKLVRNRYEMHLPFIESLSSSTVKCFIISGGT